jgi:hypothetical protein
MPRKSLSPGALFNLKEWLTLEDAAKHLTIVFGEEVKVSDVLRLAIDKRLTLSVNFVNHGEARKGRLIPLEQCTFKVFRNLEKALKDQSLIMRRGIPHSELQDLGAEIEQALIADEAFLTPEALAYRTGEFLVLEDHTSSISGVWDLPMLGGEAIDVEHRYQMETDGPTVTLSNLEGAFVERDGVVCQLQADYEDNEYSGGSKANLAQLKEFILENDTPKEKAEELLRAHAERRTEFLAKRKAKPSERYYPAGGLPEDAVYVVRTAALRDFENSVLNVPVTSDKPINRREETTLLNITGALLSLLIGSTPAGKPQSVFRSQAAVIDAMLVTHAGKPGISARTLEEKFAEAKRSLSAS